MTVHAPRLAGLAVVVALALAVPDALADSGALFGESARTAGMAGAVTGGAADLSAIASNPGALVDIHTPMFELTGHLGTMLLRFQRTGEPASELGRGLSGGAFSIAAPLPGPRWLRAARIGFGVHVPARWALHFVAPNRLDEPGFVRYGGRVERSVATLSLAYDLMGRLGVGLGLTLQPTLLTPTRVTYDPTRSEDPDENVVVDLDRVLELGASLVAGVRLQLADGVTLGAAWRQGSSLRAYGPNDTVAGTLVVDDRIDFLDTMAPDEWAVGLGLRPLSSLSLSVDAIWATWSSFRTLHNDAPAQPFRDVGELRVGTEWQPWDGWQLRAGYAYEPTPVPPQEGLTNFLDADRHVLALGAGFDARAWDLGRWRLDLGLRAHLLEVQRDKKLLDSMPDASAALPGQQIDNLGYPGFEATGTVWHGTLTFTAYLGSPTSEGPP